MTNDDNAHTAELILSEPELSLTADGLFTFTVVASGLPPLSPEKQTLLVLSVMPKILREMKSKIEADIDFQIRDPFGALEGDDFTPPKPN